MKISKVRREEYFILLISAVVIGSLVDMLINQYSPLFLRGGNLGFWSIFAKHFRVSGYDCWSYITISNLRIHFETIRHPLFLSILYPMNLLNHWLMTETGTNYAVYFMGAIDVVCGSLSMLFSYRIFHDVIRLNKFDSIMFMLMFFSFGHIMVAMIVPDHFVMSMMLLTLTLYLVGMRLHDNSQWPLWQSALLFFFTAGITVTNGAKTLLAALFANGRRVFSWRFILFSAILPLLLLFGIYWYQYNEFEVPQKRVIHKIEAGALKKDSTAVKKLSNSRETWLNATRGKPISDLPVLNLTDATTPRGLSAVENFFGESLQLHSSHVLEDMSFTRPVFVKYDYVHNYIIEAIIILLMLLGFLCVRQSKFLCMCVSWFAIDLLIHFLLGFGLNEVYIMTADWAFIIPISIATLMSLLNKQLRIVLRVVVVALTVYLLAWNGYLLISHLSLPMSAIPTGM